MAEERRAEADREQDADHDHGGEDEVRRICGESAGPTHGSTSCGGRSRRVPNGGAA
jgi:hypothetical protein